MSQPTQPVLSVEVDVTWDDVRELLSRRAEPPSGTSGWLWRWLGPDAWSWRADAVVLGMFLLGMTYLLALYPSMKALLAGTLTAGPLCLAGALWFHTPWGRKTLQRRGDISRRPGMHGHVGPMLVDIDAAGVWRTSSQVRQFWSWSIIEPEFTPEMIYLHYHRIGAVLVPRRSFASERECAVFIETVRRLRSSSGDVGSLGPPPGALSTPEFDLDGDDLAKAYLSGAPSLVPSRGAVTYTLLTALPVWGMCPIWNPSWQSWVAFPVGFGFQLQLLFGSKLWKRRSLRRAGNQALAKSNRSHFTGVALGVDRFGITEVTRNTRTQARWSAVKQYEVSMDVAAFHDGTGMIILPRHAFETDDAYLDFVEKALEYRRQALAA